MAITSIKTQTLNIEVVVTLIRLLAGTSHKSKDTQLFWYFDLCI